MDYFIWNVDPLFVSFGFVKTKQASYEHDFWMTTGQVLSIPFILAGLFYITLPLFKKD